MTKQRKLEPGIHVMVTPVYKPFTNTDSNYRHLLLARVDENGEVISIIRGGSDDDFGLAGGNLIVEAGETSGDLNAPNVSRDAAALASGDFQSRKLDIAAQREDEAWHIMTSSANKLKQNTYEYDSGLAWGADKLDHQNPGRFAQNSNTTVAHVLRAISRDVVEELPDGVTTDQILGYDGEMTPNPISEPQAQRRHRERRERRERALQEALQDDPSVSDLPPGHRGGQMGRHRREDGEDAAAAGFQQMSAAAGDIPNARTMEGQSDERELNARHMLARWLPTVAHPADDPVDRAIEARPGALSDADRGLAMRHDAYWEAADPRRDALHHAIRQGYRHQYGTGEQEHDETGKPRKPVEINPLPQKTPAPETASGTALGGFLDGLDQLFGTAASTADTVTAWQRALNALDKPTPAETARKRPPRGTLTKLDDTTTAPPLVPALDNLKPDGVFGPKTAAKTRRVLTKRHPRTIQAAFSGAAQDRQNNNSGNWNGL